MESLVEEGRHTLNVGNTVRGPQMDKREKKVLHEVAVFLIASKPTHNVVTCFTSPLPCRLSMMCYTSSQIMSQN